MFRRLIQDLEGRIFLVEEELDLQLESLERFPPLPTNNTPAGAGLNPNNVGSSAPQPQQDEPEDPTGEGPAPKLPRFENAEGGEEEGFNCLICTEPFTSSGDHRVCCLKCGHVFGKECIERWIDTSKRCPACNSTATKNDIRLIFAKKLAATDTAETDKLKRNLVLKEVENNILRSNVQRLERNDNIRRRKFYEREEELTILKSQLENYRREGPITASPQGLATPEPQSSRSRWKAPDIPLRKENVFLLKKFDMGKDGICKVGAYNDALGMFCVSYVAPKAPPGSSYCMKKIYISRSRASEPIQLHTKPLTDMEFRGEDNLLLTVGMDKKAILFDVSKNVVAQTLNVDSSLWACCWSGSHSNVFHVGADKGQVITYDMRAPKTPVDTLFLPTLDHSPATRLKYVPCAPISAPFSSSGLLIQKKHSVWFSEIEEGVTADVSKSFQLPIEGTFSNVDFERTSRLTLVSRRPKRMWDPNYKNVESTHIICNLRKKFCPEINRDMFSCQVEHIIKTNFYEDVARARSVLFSTDEGQVLLAANGKDRNTFGVWDVSNLQNIRFRHKDFMAKDFVHGRLDTGRDFIGVIADSFTYMYKLV